MIRAAVVSVVAALLAVIAGCGASDTSTPSPSTTMADTPSPTAIPNSAATASPIMMAACDPERGLVDNSDFVPVAVMVSTCLYTVDTTVDHGTRDGLLRAGRLLGDEYAGSLRYTRAPAPDAQWTTWAQHRAVTHVSALHVDHNTDYYLAQSRVVSTVRARIRAVGRDGWRSEPLERTIVLAMSLVGNPGDGGATVVSVTSS